MIYLDYNATTPLRPEVLEAMLPYLQDQYGNPSSYYQFGRAARSAVEQARAQVATCLHAEPAEIIFTGSGTEADNLALRGAAHALAARGRHIITSAVEHHAVQRTCQALERDGFRVTWLPVDANGQVDADAFAAAITDDTILASIIFANNETGVLQPIARLGTLARERGVVLHTDAVQAAGKLPLDVRSLPVDLLSASGHKIYGPKGSGFLYCRSGTALDALLTGGGHEHGLRAGTENVAAIVGLATALQLQCAEQQDQARRLADLRDYFEQQVQQRISAVTINGGRAPRVANTSNLSFASVESESVLLFLDLAGICASAGSACTTGSPEPSHVLQAMGVDPHLAQAALRFSLGAGTTREQLDTVVAQLETIIARLRTVSSL